jgi:hypothetical protein
MIIDDLNYWEDVAEAANVVGGSKKEEMKKKILAKKAKFEKKKAINADASDKVSVKIKNTDGGEVSVKTAVGTSVNIDLEL